MSEETIPAVEVLDKLPDDAPIQDAPRYWLPDGVYTALKWTSVIGLPAIGVGYQVLAGIWGWPYLEEVPQTLSAVALVIGVLIGISEIKGS